VRTLRSDEGGRGLSPDRGNVAPGGVNRSAADTSKRREERAKQAEEDRELLAKAHRGDMWAFRRLVERYQRRAFALAFALVRDENDARELVQDAFLRVFKGLSGFQGNSSFYTWLYRIVTNSCIDHLRKAGRHASELDESEVPPAPEGAAAVLLGEVEANPLEAIRRKEIAARLQSALDQLPSYHRAVIVLREVDGMSYEEIAEALNVSKGTVMSRLFHARQKLQRALAGFYSEQLGRSSSESPAGDRSGRGTDE
jgi:RNA polymerase sigma-70 factor (ECF subfamily)